jgi:uncharacterized cupredoxin-like copper-binding protein
MPSIKPILAAACALAATAAMAHADAPHGAKPRAISAEEHAWGREGDPAKATRTIVIDMTDEMRFIPARLEVNAGDTVKFVVRNAGKALHELVIGTEAELAKHAETMRKHPGMEHDEPYMVHVAPGRRGELAWTFTRPGTFMYGCLIPGHWEAGMKGTIVVSER